MDQNKYLNILKEELVTATGCTEPISLAYASSVCYSYLNEEVESIDAYVSGSIVKNVKCVVVPNTGGLRGIKTSIAIGVTGGKPELKLDCLSKVSDLDRKRCNELLNKDIIRIHLSKSNYIFDIRIVMKGKKNSSEVHICNAHDNIVLIKQNNKVILEKQVNRLSHSDIVNKQNLTVKEIYEFANTVDISLVKETIQNQINCNIAIAEEGLSNNYGANIGHTILASDPTSISAKAKAYAAAGSDARMNGCVMPVVINSGSGNQGLACSLPVIIYSQALKVSEEKLIRALLLSNLLNIHVKEGIGLLSAYCGAVSAGCSSGAAIAYLYGCNEEDIGHVLTNSLVVASGIICDGAKASCAAKIAIAVECGIYGYQMFKNGNAFNGGEGIVKENIEDTIKNIGKLASLGMVDTDKEILKIMMD